MKEDTAVESESALDAEVPQHVSRKAMKRMPGMPGGMHRGKKLAGLIVVLAVLIIGGGASYWYWAGKPHVDENKNINKTEYQALFLTNGQVYFGKLADLNNKYVSMTDIFYLQVQQSSSSDSSLQNASGSTTSNSQVSLAKLGSELHGPEDHMFVASDQVLFWENLKNNSKVTEAIDKYQAQ